jgi:alpha-2-macroglobulin
MPCMTRRTLRVLGRSAFPFLLAGCMQLSPPTVSPSGTLEPHDRTGGPRGKAAFQISHAAPRGPVDDGAAPGITVLFNRAMRSLESPPDQGLPGLTVQTKDGKSIPGVARWIGTRGLIFEPAEPLPGATAFVVTVPAGTRSSQGDTLTTPYSFEFTTSAPIVLGSDPVSGARTLRQDSTFRLLFNQDVAPEAVERTARLVVRQRNTPEAQIKVKVTRDVSPRRDEPPRARAVLIRPEKPLPLDAEVELSLAPGLKGEGVLPMEAPYVLLGRTYGPLRLVDFHCPRVTPAGPCRARNDLKVVLSNPVEPDELRRHLKTPGLHARKKSKSEPPDRRTTGHEQWLDVDPQIGHKYKVTLTEGMRDVFGQKLAKDVTFEIETEAPFVGGKAGGVKTANRREREDEEEPKKGPPPEPKNVPHRAQLSHELDLGLRGHVVEAKAKTGIKTHKLPVSSVNVPTFGFLTSRLDEGQTLTWLGGGGPDAFLTKTGLAYQFVSPGAPENVRSVRTVDLDALLDTSGRGSALVLLDVPGENNTRSRLVSVTDLGVSAKVSHYGTVVWVTSLATGKPVDGATVSLRNAKKGELFRVTTDPDGTAILPPDKFDPTGNERGKGRTEDPVLFVRAGDDWTFHQVERASVDSRVASQFQDLEVRREHVGIVFLDRGVYRPGETAKLCGILRALDPAGLTPPTGKDIRIEVMDGNGGKVFTTRATTDSFGMFVADLKIPKSARLGDARVTATVKDRGASTDLSTSFQLLTYRATEFKVAASAEASSYVHGDEALFHARGEYLFGGAMSEAAVHSTFHREVTSFTPPGLDGFITTDQASVEDEPESQARTADLEANDARLDPGGHYSRKVRLDLPGQRHPEQVYFEAEVEDCRVRPSPGAPARWFIRQNSISPCGRRRIAFSTRERRSSPRCSRSSPGERSGAASRSSSSSSSARGPRSSRTKGARRGGRRGPRTCWSARASRRPHRRRRAASFAFPRLDPSCSGRPPPIRVAIARGAARHSTPSPMLLLGTRPSPGWTPTPAAWAWRRTRRRTTWGTRCASS